MRHLLLTLLSIASCYPPPVAYCRPNTVRCSRDTLQICTSDQNWTAMASPCSERGETCCLTRSASREVFVYACVQHDQCEAP